MSSNFQMHFSNRAYLTQMQLMLFTKCVLKFDVFHVNLYLNLIESDKSEEITAAMDNANVQGRIHSTVDCPFD